MGRSVLPNPPREIRRRNTWIQVRILLALISLPLSLWLWEATDGFAAWRSMVIRKATPTDPVWAQSLHPRDEKLTTRAVAVAEGPVALGRPMSARLYLVSDGNVTECGSAMSGRSAERGSHYRMLQIVFMLSEADRPDGRLTVLTARGGSRSGGWGEVVHDIRPRFRQTFTGAIGEGRTYLLYIEGDRKFVAERDMTIDEFARANDGGDFLVVTVTRN